MRINQICLSFTCLSFICLLFIGFTNLSIADNGTIEQLLIPSSPNPVGSGARALGMGGAFIAVADDATAASWNPGGLIQLERPEISVVGAWFNRSTDIQFSEIPEASNENSVSETRLNYFSISYPFQGFNKNMVVSLNYQNLYEFTNQWSFSLYNIDPGGRSIFIQNSDTDQNGGLSAFGLAYCIEVISNLSLGVTFNFWEDSFFLKNQWDQTTNWKSSNSLVSADEDSDGIVFQINTEGYRKDTSYFNGFNINLGLLWNITGKWTLGAVLKTSFTAELKHERDTYYSMRYPQMPVADSEHEQFVIFDEKLTMPMSYGIGIAYRMSDNLTVSADFYRTEWGDFIHEDANGNKTSPITGEPENEADISATHQVRLGAEYLFIKSKYVIPLRGGVFYDPAPGKGSCDNYYGLSLGSGIAYKKYIFDIAFQYRFGNDVGKAISKAFGSSQDVEEFTVYSSSIIHF